MVIFLKNVFYFYLYAYVCFFRTVLATVYEHLRSQKKSLDALDLEIKAIVSHSADLGAENQLWSSSEPSLQIL